MHDLVVTLQDIYEGITKSVNTNSMTSILVQIDDQYVKKLRKDALGNLAQSNITNEN